jgi:GntR family transcriptional regulator
MHSSIHISQTDARPMYLQIMEQIRQRIALGDWQPGQELPSIRTLAVALRVSVITVKRAYEELGAEGVIVTRHGRGSFVADRVAITNDLQDQRLDEHLTEVARLARVMGLSDEEIATRLKRIRRKLGKDE